MAPRDSAAERHGRISQLTQPSPAPPHEAQQALPEPGGVLSALARFVAHQRPRGVVHATPSIGHADARIDIRTSAAPARGTV
jgi:hypothetical protein